MTKLEIDLLKKVHDNRFTQHEMTTKIYPVNGDELIPYINALKSLTDSGYLNCLSDNLDSDSFQIAPRYESVFEMELTASGIDFIRRELNS